MKNFTDTKKGEMTLFRLIFPAAFTGLPRFSKNPGKYIYLFMFVTINGREISLELPV